MKKSYSNPKFKSTRSNISVNQYYQQKIGDHINWQDKRQGSQKNHDRIVKTLSMNPGLHRDNLNRQIVSHAAAQLIGMYGILSVAQIGNADFKTSPKKIEKRSLSYNNNLTSVNEKIIDHSLVLNNSLNVSRLADQNSSQLFKQNASLSKYNIELKKQKYLPTFSLTSSKFSSSIKKNEKTLKNIHLENINETNDESIFKKQTRQLYKFLERHDLIADLSKPLTIVSNLALYLSSGTYENRISMVARYLLRPMHVYGSYKEEQISHERKLAILGEYLNHAILGMSLDTWIAKKIQNVRTYKLFWFNNRYLKLIINHLLNSISDKDELTQMGCQLFRDIVVNKSLPILTLQLNPYEMVELSKIDITQPRWGFINAGAKILIDSNARLEGLTLADICDVAMTFTIMISQRIAPAEYLLYFKLPVLIYYARHIGGTDVLALNDQEIQSVFQRYYNYIEMWQRKNNPLNTLIELTQGWKTRAALAKDTLRKKGISDQWTTTYLDSHNQLVIDNKLLLNIDKVFENQNRLLADAVYSLDKQLLTQIFNSLTTEEQIFIQQSKVNRIRIQFNALDSIRGVPLSPATRMGIIDSSTFIFRIPDHIDMLRFTFNGRERIYSLETSPQTGTYKLSRVDRERNALLFLLEDMIIPYHDPEYKIRVTSHYTLKEQTETIQKFIDNLAVYHKNKLFSSLMEEGYDITFKEKFKNLLLDLIPFYTCVRESLKGNEKSAIPACILDVGSLIPIAGQAAFTLSRFGASGVRTGAIALKYAARQATIKKMMKEAGKKWLYQFPSIAKEISPEVIKKLTITFLHSMDPGFGILTLGSVKGLRLVSNFFSKLPNKSLGLTRYSDAFSKKILFSSFFSKLETYKIESFFCPEYNKNLYVTATLEKEGQLLWTQVDQQTGELFGKRFIQDNDGNLRTARFELTKENEVFYDKKSDCYRVKRGAKLGKLCSHPSDRDIENELSMYEANVQMVNYRLREECDRIIREWSNLDIPNSEDINKLEYLASMNKDEQYLNDYIEAGNQDINNYLRYGSDTLSARYERNFIKLRDACESLDDYLDYAYRVMILPSEKLNSFQIGDILSDKGFCSASALVKNAKDWLNDNYIKRYKKKNTEYILIVYDKNVPKKIAGNDFLTDHILVMPGEKIKIESVKKFAYKENTITLLGVSGYYGNAIPKDIYN